MDEISYRYAHRLPKTKDPFVDVPQADLLLLYLQKAFNTYLN